MKQLTKNICLLVCMVLLTSILVIPVQAAICKHTYVDTVCTSCGQIGGTCGKDLTWSFSPSTGLLRISGSGTMSTYSLDFPAPWARYRYQIKEVVLGAAVTSISAYAFYECTELKTINIPKSVSNIYTSSFFKCDSLEAFVLDDDANYSLDEKGVLYNKKKTYLIALPGTFTGECVIPASAVNVGPNAAGNPFLYIDGVTNIRVDAANTKFSSDADGLLYNKEKTQLIVCPRAYSGNATIPATVTKYDTNAFVDCYGLTGIFVEEGNTVYSSTGSGLLCSADGTTVKLCPAGFTGTCVIPAEITSCPISAFSQSVGLSKFEVEEGNTKYSNDEAGMLYNKAGTKLLICPNAYVGSYELPEGVTDIAPDAFKYCPGVTGFDVADDSAKYSVDEYGVLYDKSKTTLISLSLPLLRALTQCLKRLRLWAVMHSMAATA